MHLIELLAGILQFIVAGYALRLNRLFGPARVGWSLFCAFTLLASLHLVQATTSSAIFASVTQFGNEIEVVYALISLLLLTSMAHLETVLKGRLRAEAEEKRLRAELELEVKKKTAHLTQAIEELQEEMAERQRMETEVATTHLELRTISRQAEMARIATGVLEGMADMVRSVNASASLVSDRVKKSKIANIVNIGTLIRNTPDLGRFMTQDPRGQKLPVYIAQLGEYLATEQTALLGELESLKANLENVMAMQQDYAKLSGVAGTSTAAAGKSPMPTGNTDIPAFSGLGKEHEVMEMTS